MQTFWIWLLEDRRQQRIDPAVLQGYEQEFRRQLELLIQRTKDPILRQKFVQMMGCPVTDASGRCRDFSEYIYSALIRSGVQDRYDIEAALSHVMTQMLMDRSLTSGEERTTLFSAFDEKRPYRPDENPLQARFMTFLQNTIRNITAGKIVRLADLHRPAGTVSIGGGRAKDEKGFLSADEIGGQPESNEQELLSDIITMLRQRQGEYPGIPLVDIFRSMLTGETVRQQRHQFGYAAATTGRKVIVQALEDYAHQTDNYSLIRMLDTLRNSDDAEPPRSAKPTKPKLSPNDQDYASIVSVIERRGGSVTHSILGSQRRKWLLAAPRSPDSQHANRLDDVLANMVADGVLVEKRTGAGGRIFTPGPRYEEYLTLAGV